jgi:mono/diheme cytochrome c family protein
MSIPQSFGRLGVLLVAGALVVGCATIPDSSSERRGDLADSAARGEALARRSCASCHAMGLTDESAWPGAPAFRDMRFDLNAISYERRMAQMHAGRVRHMPPAGASLDDVTDLRAYVRSLRGKRR